MGNLPPGSIGEAEHEGVGLEDRQPPQLRSDCRRSRLGEMCVAVRAWCVQARRWYGSIHGSHPPGRNKRACPQTPSPALQPLWARIDATAGSKDEVGVWPLTRFLPARSFLPARIELFSLFTVLLPFEF